MASRYERYQYIYGNTARAVEEPVRIPDQREPEKKQKVQEPAKKTVVRHHRVVEFNSKFTVNLAIAVAAMVFICVLYLNGQFQLNQQIHNISAKRTELTALINENHAKKSNLEKKVDYEELKEYAKDKLNMIVPGEKNTIYYNGTDSDYVRQYEEIPQE